MKLKERLEEADKPTTKPLRAETLATVQPIQPLDAISKIETGSRPGRREGGARADKKATVGHFSEEMSRKLNALAALEGRTLQSIMGEAWDMWLISREQPPFNER